MHLYELFSCRISGSLELPHLPDMLFPRNGLSLQHKLGFGIRFDPVEALQTVNATEDLVHVAMSKEWLEARADHANINKIAKPYDWTFTPSNYKGSLQSSEDNAALLVTTTDERIDYEKLKVQEKILFFDEIILYEDELDDNGIAKLSLKIVSFTHHIVDKMRKKTFVFQRAMPSGFFVLQRFFLRVDNTLIRVIDSRLYHDVTKTFMLREYSERESRIEDLKHISASLFTNENEIVQHLKLQKEVTEKLAFPPT